MLVFALLTVAERFAVMYQVTMHGVMSVIVIFTCYLLCDIQSYNMSICGGCVKFNMHPCGLFPLDCTTFNISDEMSGVEIRRLAANQETGLL